MKNYRNFLYGYLLADIFANLLGFLIRIFHQGFVLSELPGGLLSVVVLLLGLVMLLAVDKGYVYNMRLWALGLVWLGVLIADTAFTILPKAPLPDNGTYLEIHGLLVSLAKTIVIIGFALVTYRQNRKREDLSDYTLGVWANLFIWCLFSVFTFATTTLNQFGAIPTVASQAITWAGYGIVVIPATILFAKRVDRVYPWMLITYLCITIVRVIAGTWIGYYAQTHELTPNEIITWVSAVSGLINFAVLLFIILYYNALRLKQKKALAAADIQS